MSRRPRLFPDESLECRAEIDALALRPLLPGEFRALTFESGVSDDEPRMGAADVAPRVTIHA